MLTYGIHDTLRLFGSSLIRRPADKTISVSLLCISRMSDVHRMYLFSHCCRISSPRAAAPSVRRSEAVTVHFSQMRSISRFVGRPRIFINLQQQQQQPDRCKPANPLTPHRLDETLVHPFNSSPLETRSYRSKRSGTVLGSTIGHHAEQRSRRPADGSRQMTMVTQYQLPTVKKSRFQNGERTVPRYDNTGSFYIHFVEFTSLR